MKLYVHVYFKNHVNKAKLLYNKLQKLFYLKLNKTKTQD